MIVADSQTERLDGFVVRLTEFENSGSPLHYSVRKDLRRLENVMRRTVRNLFR